MKDAEDEAFDDIARKQGAWGGGYQAKRKMAADKLLEPEREALKRLAENLRQAGASLPAPEITGTIEGAVVTGLSIALALVDIEIEALAQTAPLPVQRQPLTEDEVLKAIQSCGVDLQGQIRLTFDRGLYEVTEPTNVAMQFAQAIEAAHNIRAKP